MSNFWSEQKEIGRVNKNKKEDIVVSLCKRNDIDYLDVRIHVKLNAENDVYTPTSKGFALKAELGEQVLNLIKEALDK